MGGGGLGVGGTTNQNGRRYKTNSLFFSFFFFKSTNQESVETESRVWGVGWGVGKGREGWNVFYIAAFFFSLVDNIKSHRRAEGKKTKNTGCTRLCVCMCRTEGWGGGG